MKQYQVQGYLTVQLLDSDGEVLTHQVGYVSAARLIAILQEAKKEVVAMPNANSVCRMLLVGGADLTLHCV